MIFLWFFLPLVLGVYFISNEKMKNLILLVASLIFYVWGGVDCLFLIIISIVVNYCFGILIDHFRRYDTQILWLAIITNLSILIYFKYFNFIAITINNVFHQTIVPLRNIILPIGISFYTFQILSYIVDLYWKNIKVQKNILNLALYVSFFPQLVAGPIVKYSTVKDEINHRKVSLKLFVFFVKKFVYGLGKKVIFANSLAFITDSIYQNSVSSLNTPIAWLASITYTLQIYYDFSGYSDMAIGLGRMFGFHFPENFNLPYISQSITEFWRRWHISLSTWFKEYVYIPLGGNRKGKFRTYINLWIVFFLTGLWHGASFNFILWGLYYGLFLVIEKMFLKKFLDHNRLPFLNNIYVMFIVIIGWVLFRAEGLRNVLEILKLMFCFNFDTSYVLLPTFINFKNLLIFVLSVLLAGPLQILLSHMRHREKIQNIYESKIEIFALILIMSVSIMELVASSYNPFIYFRF